MDSASETDGHMGTRLAKRRRDLQTYMNKGPSVSTTAGGKEQAPGRDLQKYMNKGPPMGSTTGGKDQAQGA